ncbi:hypothetical protein PCE1_001828 [Barthelona sp. PCE]
MADSLLSWAKAVAEAEGETYMDVCKHPSFLAFFKDVLSHLSTPTTPDTHIGISHHYFDILLSHYSTQYPHIENPLKISLDDLIEGKETAFQRVCTLTLLICIRHASRDYIETIISLEQEVQDSLMMLVRDLFLEFDVEENEDISVDEYTRQIEELYSKVSALESENADLEIIVGEQKHEISLLKDIGFEKNNLELEVSDLRETNAQLEEKLESLSKLYEIANGRLKNHADVLTELDDTKKQLETAQKMLSQVDTHTVKNLQERIAETEGSLHVALSDNQALKDRVSELEKVGNGVVDDDLEFELESAQMQITTLKQRIVELEASPAPNGGSGEEPAVVTMPNDETVTALEKDIVNLKMQISTLEEMKDSEKRTEDEMVTVMASAFYNLGKELIRPHIPHNIMRLGQYPEATPESWLGKRKKSSWWRK